jgi:hypothetical protein
MGQNTKTQTTGSMPRESSQVGTHGDAKSKDWSQGQGSQNKGQGQYRGQGQPMKEAGQGTWNDRAQRPMEDGDQTRPTQPSGTSPIDKHQPSGTQDRTNR